VHGVSDGFVVDAFEVLFGVVESVEQEGYFDELLSCFEAFTDGEAGEGHDVEACDGFFEVLPGDVWSKG